jgi:hypothetical protein
MELQAVLLRLECDLWCYAWVCGGSGTVRGPLGEGSGACGACGECVIALNSLQAPQELLVPFGGSNTCCRVGDGFFGNGIRL